MTDAILPVLQTAIQDKKMPARRRYDKKHINARLDDSSVAALERLMKRHGKDVSKIVREALIEKDERESQNNNTQKSGVANA